MTEPLLLSRAQAAAFLGVPLRTFERHIRPHLKAVCVGSRRLFTRKSLAPWMAVERELASLLVRPGVKGIYYLVCMPPGSSPVLKIGWATCILRRVTMTQTANAWPLTLAAFVPGKDIVDEHAVHSKFASLRVNAGGGTEWFYFEEPLRRHVAEIREDMAKAGLIE